MKAAHTGVPVAGLPSGTWRSFNQPAPEARPADPTLPMRDPADGQAQAPLAPVATPPDPAPRQNASRPGAPMTINQAGERLAQPRGPAISRGGDNDDLLPPASIPQGGRMRTTAEPIPPKDRNFLEKLFGG